MMTQEEWERKNKKRQMVLSTGFWLAFLALLAFFIWKNYGQQVSDYVEGRRHPSEDSASVTRPSTSTSATPTPDAPHKIFSSKRWSLPELSPSPPNRNLDLNGDGHVSDKEAEVSFKIFDKNYDGTLTGTELTEAKAALAFTLRTMLFRALDHNHDGKVTPGETWETLSAFDFNDDGEIDEWEMDSYLQSFRAASFSQKAWVSFTKGTPKAKPVHAPFFNLAEAPAE